jgi:hypothetical protein
MALGFHFSDKICPDFLGNKLVLVLWRDPHLSNRES